MAGSPIPKTKNKKKVRPWAKVRDDCDTVFSKIIRTRGACEACGSPWYLQCAHGFSRAYYATRFDEESVFCLCRGCHKKYTHRPLEWAEWMLDRMGHELYWQKWALALTHERPDVRELLPVLRARLAELKAVA